MKALHALFYVSVIFFVSCKPAKTTVNEVKSEDVITLKFIQLNDVYEIAPLSGGKYGGMARVAHCRFGEGPKSAYLSVYGGRFFKPFIVGYVKS